MRRTRCMAYGVGAALLVGMPVRGATSATPETSAAVPPASAQVAEDDARALTELRLIVPVAGVRRSELRDTYDDVRGSARHEALDIAAARRTPVVAAADGRVAKLFRSRAGGITVYQFEPGGRYALYYAHLDSYASELREGAEVRRGQVIGYVGTTGNAPPNAPHLHFAIFRLGVHKRWWKGTPIDPYPFLRDP